MEGLFLANVQWAEINYDFARGQLLRSTGEEVITRAHESALRAWQGLEAARRQYYQQVPDGESQALIHLLQKTPRFRMP